MSFLNSMRVEKLFSYVESGQLKSSPERKLSILETNVNEIQIKNYLHKHFKKLFWIISACRIIQILLNMLWTLMMKLGQVTVNYSATTHIAWSLFLVWEKAKTYFLVFSEDENFRAMSWVLFCKYGAGGITLL